MAHAHHHGHHHPQLDRERGRRGLTIALGLTLAVFAAEVLGGLAGGSLALLADAGHMLTDAAALLLALL
ncbi:MAG TPA: cation transporter, partial [Gaiellales bacterium]|nr:cation transporter [Gaiellales bacterium]